MKFQRCLHESILLPVPSIWTKSLQNSPWDGPGIQDNEWMVHILLSSRNAWELGLYIAIPRPSNYAREEEYVTQLFVINTYG